MDFDDDFEERSVRVRSSGHQSMDRAHLERMYEDGEQWDVTIFLRCPDGSFDVESPITATMSEQFPIDHDEVPLFTDISHDIERCSWQFYAPCMSRGNDRSWSPASLVIPVGSVVRVGVSNDWYIVESRRIMQGTTWRCPSVQRIDSQRKLV